ncbi:DHHC palmitoyltransferase-domain-containing protein [Endogone sp. FLAS-F59071]|nr:DHHC palmitoyltransferase-domain-containing protein [Endogone sp. FLAS-F59071]|eukprot:RUS18940.1 DHHC palmitoyltransferase-domain-containing protein [Endogone sp. FLAS-F59071]
MMAKNSCTHAFGYTLPVVVFAMLGYTWYVYTFQLCVYQLIGSGRVAQAGMSILRPNSPEPLFIYIYIYIYLQTSSYNLVCYFILFNILLGFSVFSYIRVLSTPPGSPSNPPPYHPRRVKYTGSSDARHDSTTHFDQATESEPQSPYSRAYSPTTFNMITMEPKGDVNLAIPMPTVSLCKRGGQPRYCDRCRCVKPDRTHHCRECDACVLKMDQVNGCVGFANYKFFFLFVLYTAVFALWTLVTIVPEVVYGIQHHGPDLDFHFIIVVILSFLFGLLLACFVGVHLYYILHNRTTIEAISDRPYHARVDLDPSPQGQGLYQVVPTDYGEHLWNIGYANNWKSVMGSEAWAWFLPIYTTPGTGLTFPYTNSVYNRFVREAEKRHSSPMPPLAAVVPPSPSSFISLDDSRLDGSNGHSVSNLVGRAENEGGKGPKERERRSLEFEDRDSSDYERF